MPKDLPPDFRHWINIPFSIHHIDNEALDNFNSQAGGNLSPIFAAIKGATRGVFFHRAWRNVL